jgi:hypothetical protein
LNACAIATPFLFADPERIRFQRTSSARNAVGLVRLKWREVWHDPCLVLLRRENVRRFILMSLAPVALSGKRIAFLDTARAVAALAVLFQHSLEGAGLVSLTKQALGQTVVNFGEVGVLVFFLVSGFIIPASLEKIRNQAEFWRRRALRIYPLYFAVMVTNLILGWLVYHTQAPAAWKLLPHIVFVQT